MTSWILIADDSDFSLQNLPYGIFSTENLDRRIGVAIGDYVLDLKALAQDDIFAFLNFDSVTLEATTLNAYASLEKNVHRNVRKLLQEILSQDTPLGSVLRDHTIRRERVLVPLASAKMHMPMQIGDYTDFFVGLYHAQNVCSITSVASPVDLISD
jgi:fumarylacetoacetase